MSMPRSRALPNARSGTKLVEQPMIVVAGDEVVAYGEADERHRHDFGVGDLAGELRCDQLAERRQRVSHLGEYQAGFDFDEPAHLVGAVNAMFRALLAGTGPTDDEPWATIGADGSTDLNPLAYLDKWFTAYI